MSFWKIIFDTERSLLKLKNLKKNALEQQNIHPERQPGQMSQSIKRNNSSIIHSQASQMNDINYGTLLYHRGVKKNEELQKHLIAQRKQKLEINSQECTFQPALNNISRQIMSVSDKWFCNDLME